MTGWRWWVGGSLVVLALLGCTKEMSSEEKAKASSAEFEKRKPALEAQVKAIQVEFTRFRGRLSAWDTNGFWG